MKTVIAGAGIGGLSAALCLAEDGHEVHIVEQTTELAEIGAGIQCGANAVHVLDSLGLADAVREVAVDPESIAFREFDSGRLLHTIPLGTTYAARFGKPYLHIGRADLHKVIADAVSQSVAITLHTDSRVTGFTETPDAVNVDLANGRNVEGHCLVASDGIHSVVRQQLLSAGGVDYKPRWTGNVAWRGTLDASRLPEGFMPKVGFNFVGPGKHIVIYYLHNQQQLNFVAVVEAMEWQDDSRVADSWVEKAPWEELKRDFSGWHETVQTVIDHADKEACYRWALYQHNPIDNWSSERVTLLGDAAHASLPFMAAGAAMALEDARVLQRAIAQCDTLSAGLQMYQRNRIPRTRKIQRASNMLGKIYHLPGKPLRGLAFKLIQTLGKRTQDSLPSYNANTVELH